MQACCECDSATNEPDAAVHAAMPHAAAKTAVDVIAAAVGGASSLLVEQTLVAIEKASGDGDGFCQRRAIDACVLMLLELAGREELEGKIVAASAAAAAAVKAVKIAEEGQNTVLAPGVHRVLALYSQKLGSDLLT